MKVKNGKILMLSAHIFGDGPNMAEVITGVLTTLYKWDDTKVKELLKDGATPADVLKGIYDADKERVKTLTSTKETEKFQEGYKKAKKEVLTENETALKAEFEYEGDETGIDLTKAIIAKQGKGSGSANSEEEIKKSTTYLTLERKMKKEIADLTKAHETKVKEIEAGFSEQQTFIEVGKNALDLLPGLKPILPKNLAVADKQKQLYVNEFKQYKFEKKDGRIIVLDLDGKVVTDEHGHTLEFDTLAKNIAGQIFEFAENNGGTSAGNNNDKGGAAGGTAGAAAYPAGVTKPKTIEELSKLMNDGNLKAPEKRTIMNEWEKDNGKK